MQARITSDCHQPRFQVSLLMCFQNLICPPLAAAIAFTFASTGPFHLQRYPPQPPASPTKAPQTASVPKATPEPSQAPDF